MSDDRTMRIMSEEVGPPRASWTGDDRDDLLTVTMTREQWDGALRAGSSYAEDEYTTRDFLHDTALKGYDARLTAAREAFEATVPVLDPETMREMRETADRLLREFRAGTLDVDHLGQPSTQVGGFRVSITPHINGGGSAFHFTWAKDPWFSHKQYPLRAEDRGWFVSLACELTGQDPAEAYAWNQGGPWVSVRFAA